jgi:hypothetical protein
MRRCATRPVAPRPRVSPPTSPPTVMPSPPSGTSEAGASDAEASDPRGFTHEGFPPEGSDLTAPGVLRIALGGVVEYFRWTQLVPLFTAWLVTLVLVILMLLVAFQGSVDSMLGALESRAEDLPWIEQLAGRIFDSTSDGTMSMNSDQVARWIGGAWAGFSAVLFVGSGVRRSIWGAPPRRPLRRKLGWVLAAAGVTWGILQLTRILAPIPFGDSVARWALMTAAMLMVVVVISTWSVGVSHVLARVRDALLAEGTG